MANQDGPRRLALGGLVVAFSQMEAALQQIAWRLIDPDDMIVGRAITGGMTCGQIVSAVERLAPYRCSAPTDATLTALLPLVKEAIEHRNDYLHSHWLNDPVLDAADGTSIDRIRYRKRFSREYFADVTLTDPSKIDELAHRCSDLERELVAVLLDIQRGQGVGL